MATQEEEEEAGETQAMLQGQAQILSHMCGFADLMAMRCAVELRIADIIHSHGSPITLSHIAASIDDSPSSPDIACLARIMRLLVRKKIFISCPQSDGGDPLYGLTHSSRWLLHDADLSIAPMVLTQSHPWLTAPWVSFGSRVKEGGSPFKKAHGREIWEFASENPEFNVIVNEGMACMARISIRAVVAGYKDGFSCMGSLVDVGGGTGWAAAEIIKAHPHIKAINFDLPHVIATAPMHPGISHVGGDMFKAIPNADAIFMQWIMHDWNDEDCVKILKTCRKAVPEKTGKVIIVDIVLQPDGNDPFDDTRVVIDLALIAQTSGGKERTELEWKKIFEEGGFPRYKIIKIPALQSIIEAYPE